MMDSEYLHSVWDGYGFGYKYFVFYYTDIMQHILIHNIVLYYNDGVNPAMYKHKNNSIINTFVLSDSYFHAAALYFTMYVDYAVIENTYLNC